MSTKSPSWENRRRIRQIADEEMEENGVYAAVELLERQAEIVSEIAEEYEDAGMLDEDGRFRVKKLE